ncbi:MAG: endopeptidase La [Candidatus Levybacteria bacterium RIFOXYA1_FULL_41_10]|nr:MAG: Lon protease [Candidatus Levybacteria bacterium GW2011_GWC1_40_19]KKR94204.1 MAG: Lon protease [Candidatus Levybacteria bacterium GW2011_GWA2_41_15]OGH25626.1 MAG: endopeptidase La [Candidatus Levybacteria bacterium RIFCSPHIGHO2_02_FULL_40_29]OGH42176.1 MAG: endopeptidase La [Candidatus Levybacteria bacterium RIFCSPLOWO2_01_FULL_40_96]OGH50560.1 MAG: endopeptidase La [Candidatus Levybacteria bacterium RIFCSPLOWO2_02_FULL_40_18]OGH52575.1 MAG: endopeptidase La [Candidatus Levybacteria b
MEKIVPIIPIRDGIIFPNTDSVLTFGRPKSLLALEQSFSKERIVCFVLQKNSKLNDPAPSDLYTVGTLCRIERMIKSDGEINAHVKGLARVKITSFENRNSFLLGSVKELQDEVVDTPEIRALCNHLTNEFRRAMNLGKAVDFLVFMNIMSESTPSQLSDLIASVLDLRPVQRQELLTILNVRQRLEKVADLLAKEIKVLELERKIDTKTKERFEKGAREVMLRERLRTIEKELGESEEDNETREILMKIKEAGMPEEIEEKARKEAKKLSQMTQFNPEAGYVRNYLEWLIDLPWSKVSENNVNVKAAEKVLDEDHYGLKDAKERIVEYLAVHKLSGKMKGPILCFAGPPGVGKTSIGKSIARALGREFVKVSLGGIRDEAEIRGHRRTYVGALPGRIIQGIKEAKTKNPVFMLDEIDKVGADFRGDPSSALLEALDPEQNHSFSDHYLEVPFDLSDVMFITTANVLYTIPPALRDRLEVINFAGYTHDEKFKIAKDFLIKKQMESHGLTSKEIEITDSALKFVIEHYTREAGVRSLERQIARLLRKVAKLVAEGKKKKITITAKNTTKFLGPIKMRGTMIEKKDDIGLATGLAWTEAGGDILFIEVALMPGKGQLILTGQLGDIMKESCQAAMSYVRARGVELGLSPKFFQKLDIHIHVPEGAVPKDGPSAGIAITTAITSALTKIPINRLVGGTGEVTLRGRVLEIGGVKEKVIAAHRAGLKTIILPKDNKKDLVDIPKEVLTDLKFVFVDHMDEVLDVFFTKKLPKIKVREVSERPVLQASTQPN